VHAREVREEEGDMLQFSPRGSLTLEDLEILKISVLSVHVELDASHRYIHCRQKM
jgi:hypothetical protein